MVMYARRIDTSSLKQYDDGLRRGGRLTHVEQESRESHTPAMPAIPSMPSSQRCEAEILTGEAGEGRPLEDDSDGNGDTDGSADGAGHLSASNASRRIIAGLADQVGVCHH
jgi:hypothetical protein